MRVMSRGARFREWQALPGNRGKRQRAGEFLVQGVRPVAMAVRFGREIRELLCNADVRLSAWARDITAAAAGAARADVSGGLMAELGGRAGQAPELPAVAGIPAGDLSRIPAGPGSVVVVFGRPGSPGSIGTLIRPADAIGASLRAAGTPVQVAGTDEDGGVDAAGYDFTRPALLVTGNETAGLSSAWRQACDCLIPIPMPPGAASSPNAATAASVLLHEPARQRAESR
jgi:tRNA G18 (ribose-2'-O)-methylase SpoU